MGTTLKGGLRHSHRRAQLGQEGFLSEVRRLDARLSPPPAVWPRAGHGVHLANSQVCEQLCSRPLTPDNRMPNTG